MPSRKLKKNFNISQELLIQVDKASVQLGISRNMYITLALQQKLQLDREVYPMIEAYISGKIDSNQLFF